MDQVADLFLQPMHSPKYRKKMREGREKKQESGGDGMKMSEWVAEGRLESSLNSECCQNDIALGNANRV